MPPDRVHVYELVEPAPRGGPGSAFRARVAEPGGPLPVNAVVQVRLLTEEEAGGAAELQELAKEHGAARRIASRFVGSPVDFGILPWQGARRFWSACPWASGRTLSEVLAGIGAVPDPLVDSIAKQTAEAMRAVHLAGVRSVCLSPDSVLVQDDASALVLDPALGGPRAAAWPRGGPIPASLACAAPEAIRSRAAADERADLYSLGATLFRAMTGMWHRPDDAQAVRCDPESFPARRPGDVRPRVSRFLDELVFVLLQTDPSRRIASFAALVKILEERRESSWWRGLHVAPPARDAAPSASDAFDPEPPPIPASAPPPDAAWLAERHARELRLSASPGRLVGRDDELRGLVEAATRLDEKGGQVRLIQGGGGSGRTRLIDALLDAVRTHPTADAPIVLAGEHRRLGIGRPMRAFTEAITRLVADDREVGADQIAPLLGAAAGIAPAFAAFLSGREPEGRTPPLTKETMLDAYARATTALCAVSPVVLVVENLHWADPEGLELFAQLARLAVDSRLLLIGTHLPVAKETPLGRTLASLRTLDHVATVKLEAFSEAETLALAATFVAPDERGVALATKVHAAARGVPSFVVETLRLLAAEGSIARDAAGRARATERALVGPLPASESEMWRRRLALLPAQEQAMLSMAAVQGFAFDAEVARLALKLDPTQAERALAGLSAASLVVGAGPARRFGSDSLFDHLHDALDDAALEACHVATADAFLAARNPGGLPPSATHGILSYRVAWHYLLAGRSSRGLLYVDPALSHLRSTWRLGDAERLAELAVRAMAGDPARGGELVDVLLARAEFLGGQGRRAEQRELVNEALMRVRDPKDAAREARVLHESARLRFVVNEPAMADAEAREALAAARAIGDERLVTKCLALLGSVAVRTARYDDARQSVNEMLEIARRCVDPAGEAEALRTLGAISQGVGSFEHAEELHSSAIRIYRRAGDLAREADALASLGDIAAASGDLAKAEGFLVRALAVERAVGDGQGEARVLGRLGMVLQEAQRCPEARVLHEQCLHVTRRLNARHNEVVALLNLATSDYVLGRIDDARACYGDAMRLARELREPRLMGYALTGLGEVARQSGEPEIARGLFERAVARFRRSDDQAGLAAALLAAGRIEVFGGQAARAGRFLAEARELAALREAAYVGALAVAFQALLAARRGAAEEALATMVKSGVLVEGVRAGDALRLELAFVHALVQRVLGRHAEADRKLLQSEALLMETTLELSRDDRERVFSNLSPHREILAGVAAARAAAKAREGHESGTVPV